MSPTYISNDELSQIIKSDKQPRKDYLIVDVRDDDYRGGHIKGSHNLPSQTFHVAVDKLVQETKDVPLVIFHCALSQARGPKAARIYAETRDNLQKAGQDQPHEVLILRGGFTDFQAKFKNDAALIEDFDPEVWGNDWNS
ncbi:Rhodanese-like protein [Stereum hirsutum FP-91666 SS1]|uniref:Rhodanese-like protein n=1 Tax=Stereum hirsutum (strain FP-91666) TaxID=721885 RepID=UPI00044499B6|nr:Rhodanese-like protein [Stereum hirsutum FP-91666 SS1]EIM86008.1 Rhodanese-like protein [Stereum hirsutum FP-91666 SS1]